MLSASADPRRCGVYHGAGFRLHPQMPCAAPHRSPIPVIENVREGTAADFDLMDSLDRRTRGAGHGPDHQLMLRPGGCWSPHHDRVGLRLRQRARPLALLAASNRRTATRLSGPRSPTDPEQVAVPHITGANQWALDVGFAARLELHQDGFLGLRGMKPPAPYVHNGALI